MSLIHRVAGRISNKRFNFTNSKQTTVQSFYPMQPTCQIPNLDFIFETFFGLRRNGIYVEVGAFDGISFSNSYGLAFAGWEGHLFEPIFEFAELARANYTEHANVQVHELAITSQSQDLEFKIKGTLTTASETQAKEYDHVAWAQGEKFTGLRTVSGKTLNEALGELALPNNFELLVVDVEGHETEVFEGFDLVRWRPQMIIVELADFHPDLSVSASAHSKLRRTILSNSYTIVYKDHINTIFVTNELDFEICK